MSRKEGCKHFNGLFRNDCCAAGVNYRQLAGEPLEGYGSRLPCFGPSGLTGTADVSAIVPCAKFAAPTPEEIEADEREMRELFAKKGKARAAIVAHLGGPWKKGTPGAAGSIPCPCCDGGTLRFTRAGYNGHIHAGCSSPDCVRWME